MNEGRSRRKIGIRINLQDEVEFVFVLDSVLPTYESQSQHYDTSSEYFAESSIA